MLCHILPAIVTAIALGATHALAAELSAGTPLSRGFGTTPLGGSMQAPALWYYGPSYSSYYDRLPAGVTYTGPIYQPSPSFDPYYGTDYLDRSLRGDRYGR